MKIRVPVDDSIKRICKVCSIEKQLNTEFSYHSSHDLYRTFCKDCENERRRLKYAGLPIPEEFSNIKKRVKRKIIFEAKPYRKTQFYNRKRLDHKAVDKKKGWVSDLTIEFIEQCYNSNCTYCGYPACTIDRIDNNIGHIISNCVPACYECNTARNRLFSFEEMKLLGKLIKEIKDSRIDYNPVTIFPRNKYDNQL